MLKFISDDKLAAFFFEILNSSVPLNNIKNVYKMWVCYSFPYFTHFTHLRKIYVYTLLFLAFYLLYATFRVVKVSYLETCNLSFHVSISVITNKLWRHPSLTPSTSLFKFVVDFNKLRSWVYIHLSSGRNCLQLSANKTHFDKFLK